MLSSDATYWLCYGAACFLFVLFIVLVAHRRTRPLHEREDVRAILAALGNGEAYAFEVAYVVGKDRIDGLLERMEDAGLITSRLEPPSSFAREYMTATLRVTERPLPRRLYRRTA